MRGRTVPALNSTLLRNASSYVQINIYDTNLKALRKRGVDVEHFLQHVGCRSVVMDVPIFSSEVKKSSRYANHRLSKSFGGFNLQADDILLDESQRSAKSFEPHKTQHDTQDISLDADNDQELYAEMNATRTAFNEPMVDSKVVRGSLTSTPMVTKSCDSFKSFISANGALDDTLFHCGRNDSGTGTVSNDKFLEQPSKLAVNEKAGSSSFCACFIDKGVDAYSNKDSAEFCDPVGNEVERSFVRPKELSDNFTDSTIRTAVDTFCDIAHATSVCVQDVDQPQVGASKNALFNNREVSRRKRMRPTSPQEDPCKENAEDTCKPEEVCAIENDSCVSRVVQEKSVPNAVPPKSVNSQHCKTTIIWRRRYGKNRLVDHVRVHWGKEVKQCKLCGFKTTSFRNVRHHHQTLHTDVPYQGSLSTETKEDINELLELWKKCFPNIVDDLSSDDDLHVPNLRRYLHKRKSSEI